ncbi:PA14 domain-containing protein [Spirosoma arcticum]
MLMAGWFVTPLLAQRGLQGAYFRGTFFEHPVLTRLDSTLNFDWSTGRPAPGMPHSYYSVRWTGTLRAPVTGEYRFYAQVDDGIRVWIDNKLVVESWQLNDSQHYTGGLMLQAGHQYDLWVEYFNDRQGGEVKLYWQRPDVKKLFFGDRSTTPGEIIPAAYFAPPATPKPIHSRAMSAPPIARLNRPIITTKQRLTATAPKPRPVAARSVRARTSGLAVPTPPPVPIPPVVVIKPGPSFVLPQVQFEQSSYRLVADASTPLTQLVVALNQHQEWRLEVAGHTDNVGDARLNQALSEQRARVVAHYLSQHGIADSRISTRGYGGSRPLADNGVPIERAKNRRVEFTIR